MTSVAIAIALGFGPRVRYDGHCLTIDGKDTFIYSGAFHYFRCPKQLWADRLRKMKQAGLNTVETYVPWNWHERNAPASLTDMSKVDLTDLRDFLKMVHDDFGMYSIVRPGPYICAEWAAGGYPRWLVGKRPATWKGDWYRTNEPTYLAWCKHWYDAVCPVIAKEQISHKPAGQPGTILVQIENEYDYAGLPQNVMVGQLKALRKDAKANGIDVPLFTCWTWPVRKRVDPELRDVFDGSNMYDRHNIRGSVSTVAALRQAQPNAPVMIPELQGGWFSQVGGTLSEDQPGLDPAQIRAITLASISQGATITSYYMMFGGSHLEDFAGRSLTTSYDYASPIREWGAVGARYAAVREMGDFLGRYGSTLARTDAVPTLAAGPNNVVVHAVRKAKNGRLFAFVFNENEKEGRAGEVHFLVDSRPIKLDVSLDPFEYKVYVIEPDNSVSDWPKPQKPVKRPEDDPPSVRVRTSIICAEPAMPTKWYPRKPDQNLLDLGVNDARFTLWRSIVNLTEDEVKKYSTVDLRLNSDDGVVASVNDKVVFPVVDGDRSPSFNVKGLLKVGRNKITVLYEDRGLSNGGSGMEQLGYIRSGGLGTGVGAGRVLNSWLVHEVASEAGGVAMASKNLDSAGWTKCAPGDDASKVISNRRATAIYTTNLTLSAEDLKARVSRLKFSRIDDSGVVFVNGHEVARHNDWATPLEVDVAKYLVAGDNVITAVVSNRDGEGGLTMPVQVLEGLVDRRSLAWEVAPQLQGMDAAFWHPDTVTSFWIHNDLNSRDLPVKGNGFPKLGRDPKDALAKWVRVDFNLPRLPPKIWYPWSAVINASGNGFLWLNGHPIGRYWQAGPQRQFYLPECYLKIGGPNVLVMCLRTTSDGARVGGVEIKTYPGQGEIR